MPELPEVEVTCRGLRSHLLERRILAVRSSGKPLRQPLPEELIRQCLCNNIISAVERRAREFLIRHRSRRTRSEEIPAHLREQFRRPR